MQRKINKAINKKISHLCSPKLHELRQKMQQKAGEGSWVARSTRRPQFFPPNISAVANANLCIL